MNKVISFLLFLVGVWIVYEVFRKKNFESVNVDKLMTEDVIGWFKRPENVELMKSDNNLICILLKDQEALKNLGCEGSQFQSSDKVCIQAIFNKKNNSIKKARIIKYKELDEIILRQFGDKDMIVYN